MISYPMINPVAIQIGPIAIYWYGIFYLLAFTLCWGMLTFRLKKPTFSGSFTLEQLSDIVFYAAIGVIAGGRLGYIFFYNLDAFLADPWVLFQVWKGGMSFHGGLIGVMVALWICAIRQHKRFLALTDLVAPVVPIGLGLGRIANFINGELWGRETDLPWGMVFPNAGDIPRHPSQLYESSLEGVVLFVLLWIYSSKSRPVGSISGLFLIAYGLFRFFLEFFREPDIQIGFVAWGWMTKGQLLSIPMIFFGIGLLTCAYMRKKPCNNI